MAVALLTDERQYSLLLWHYTTIIGDPLQCEGNTSCSFITRWQSHHLHFDAMALLDSGKKCAGITESDTITSCSGEVVYDNALSKYYSAKAKSSFMKHRQIMAGQRFMQL